MKKITMMLFALSLFGLLSTTMMAQSLQPKNAQVEKDPTLSSQQQTPIKKCGFDDHEAFARANDPAKLSVEQFEDWIRPKIAQIQADRAAGRNVQVVYNIPVVIHVIHNGDALGTGENITDKQALSEINVLNQDFRRMMGTPGYGAGVDVEINFCIAQTDPSGVATTGVEHINYPPTNNAVANGSGGPDWEKYAEIDAMKAATGWDPNNYMNFWTIRLANAQSGMTGSDFAGGTYGFATFPGGTANVDGSVCHFDAMGTQVDDDGTFILGIAKIGRTMTHEVGHWLSLYHTFGTPPPPSPPGSPPVYSCSLTDYCADTPDENGYQFGCTTKDTCPSVGNDPIKNYMDYSADTCVSEFTQNQKDRMVAVLASGGNARRIAVRNSTRCQTTTPIIKYVNPVGSINEDTNCSFTEISFPIQIGKGPSKDATITFDVTGSTATAGADYQIMTPTVTFATGLTTVQNMTVRFFHDGLVEGDETINVLLVLNANGGDATLDPAAKDMVITIKDDDVTPVPVVNTTVFTEDFENMTDWSQIDADGDSEAWFQFTTGTPGTVARAAASQTDNTIFGGSGSLTPDNYLISSAITIPTGVDATTLKYNIGAYTTKGGTTYAEHYSVYFTTNITNQANIQSGTPIESSTVASGNNCVTKTFDLTALGLAGQTGYLVFRHHNTTGNGVLLVDTIEIKTTKTTNVQTTVNTTTAYNGSVPATGTAHATDSATGNIILSVEDNDNFNYGCNTISLSRDATTAGAPAVNYGASIDNNLKVMAKSFTVATAISNPTGTSAITFYFTDAEIAAWESATGNLRANLKVLKQGGGYTPATLGTFGSNISLRMTSATGADGIYFFGRAPIPTISYAAPTATPNENTTCSPAFTEYDYPILLNTAASENADITFNVTSGGTATQGIDYDIVNSTVTFLAGTTTTQNLRIRVYNDGLFEGSESFNVTMSLNANSGDAVLDPAAQDMTITINDDEIDPATTATIQTAANIGVSAYNTPLYGTGILNATDTTSGDLMLSLTNNTLFNYGCTDISVSRDAALVSVDLLGSGNPKEEVLGKAFTITTANANPTGSADVTFYFTEAEIAAWETATANSRSNLKMIKTGDTAYSNVTIGAFGSSVTLTANFANGFTGEFNFGVELIPTISFDNPTATIIENTTCTPAFTEYDYAISIVTGASENADITFNVTPGGTATQGIDYDIVNSTVTFLAGTTTTQNLRIRVYNDGLFEGSEDFNVTMSLNNNSGDAVLDPAAQDMTITINDDEISPATTATIQTAANIGVSAYNTPLYGTGILNATDTTSGDLMLSLTNNTLFNYGCTDISVSRDAALVSVDLLGSGNPKEEVLGKAFTITTANANPTGSADVTFYFTETEISAWEAATVNSRANLKMIKTGDTAYSNVTIGAFGSSVTLTANFATGFTGEFNFGVELIPTVSFDNPTATIVENTTCTPAFTEYDYPISILTGASENADITFNVTPGGTATQGIDYDIVNSTVTFLAGTTTTQNLRIRVYNDGLFEGSEDFNVTMSLNNNSGDAVLDPAAQDMTITISDDEIDPATTATIQTATNIGVSAYNTPLYGTGILNATDTASGDLMLSLTNNTLFDYGCTDISVSRDASLVAVNFGGNTDPKEQVLGKAFTITTATANPGSADVTFYFTEAEIAAWETATANSRANLKMIKTSDTAYSNVAIGAFGSSVTLTANFATGFTGEFNFGVELPSIISFDNPTATIVESTNCTPGFTDYDYAISIDSPASADAEISFMASGTATAGDYEIRTSTVIFTAGTTTPQNLTVRVFHDGLVEGSETISVMMMLNANGGNATLDATKQDMTITINDDDNAPIAGGTVTVFSENWEALGAGWSVIDGDGDTNNWRPVNGAEGLIGNIMGVSIASETDLKVLGTPTSGTAVPNNYIISPAITIPSGISSATLTYLIGYYTAGTGAGEHYEVYFTADATSEASILAGTVLQPDTITPASLTTEQRTNDMTALAGQTGFLVYRHIANPSGDGLIFLDTIDIVASSGTAVQSPVNTSTAYNAAVTGTGMAYATDSATGNIMLRITDNDGFDYGCTTVSVSRDSSTPAYDFGGNTATNLKVMGKVFSVVPTNVSASGSVDFTFYFTEAEIASWEAATGNVRADLKAVKLGSSTYVPVSIGTFGSDVTLTASFSTGASGDYHFGVDPLLSNTSFNLSDGISIYPNPTKDVLNISTSDLGLPTSYTIYNSLGQVIKNVSRVAQKDLTISTASYSNGVYFIQIEKDGASTTKKFVKN